LSFKIVKSDTALSTKEIVYSRFKRLPSPLGYQLLPEIMNRPKKEEIRK